MLIEALLNNHYRGFLEDLEVLASCDSSKNDKWDSELELFYEVAAPVAKERPDPVIQRTSKSQLSDVFSTYLERDCGIFYISQFM